MHTTTTDAQPVTALALDTYLDGLRPERQRINERYAEVCAGYAALLLMGAFPGARRAQFSLHHLERGSTGAVISVRTGQADGQRLLWRWDHGGIELASNDLYDALARASEQVSEADKFLRYPRHAPVFSGSSHDDRVHTGGQYIVLDLPRAVRHAQAAMGGR